jgi:hypothetical protein
VAKEKEEGERLPLAPSSQQPRLQRARATHIIDEPSVGLRAKHLKAQIWNRNTYMQRATG